jgi:hypothetical protein
LGSLGADWLGVVCASGAADGEDICSGKAHERAPQGLPHAAGLGGHAQPGVKRQTDRWIDLTSTRRGAWRPCSARREETDRQADRQMVGWIDTTSTCNGAWRPCSARYEETDRQVNRGWTGGSDRQLDGWTRLGHACSAIHAIGFREDVPDPSRWALLTGQVVQISVLTERKSALGMEEQEGERFGFAQRSVDTSAGSRSR